MTPTRAHIVSSAVIVAMMSTAGLVMTSSSVARAAGPVVIIAEPDGGPCVDLVPGTGVFECSLANGVAKANAHPGSTIMLAAGTYTLGAPLTVTKNGTKIVGADGADGANEKAASYVIDAKQGKGFIVDADDVRITGVTITNAADSNGNGGAILVKRNSDGFHLVDSSIENSSAREGGGIYVDGSAVIVGSTFVGNSASRKGGAVRVAGTLEVVNSTFTENTAQSGGAISVAGVAAISFSTFVDNTSNNQKGGGVDRNGGTVYVTGSILTQANQVSADGSDCSGNPDLIGPNYVGNAQGCNPDASVLIGTVDGVANLGELDDYLGPTRTFSVSEGSVVIDRANSEACHEIGLDGVVDGGDPAVDFDQRGFGRPSGAGCDLGSYELTPLEIGLELTASTDTPYVGARFLPSSDIAESVIATDTLFQGSLEASPLNAFPLESAPLNAFPLNAFPLNAFPLNAFPLNAFDQRVAFPLNAFFLAEAPLNAFPLNAFPLNAFPLNAFPLNAFPLSDLVLTEGTWEELLAGTDYEGVPLQSLTLGDVQGVTGVQNLSLGQLNLEGTPLNAFPLNAFLLGSIPLNAFPLNAFDIPDGGNWCDTEAFQAFCDAFPSDPTLFPNDEVSEPVTLATAALAGVPLNAFPLNAFPLNAFPLNAFPLNAFPLNAFPLNAFATTASPLNAFPLNAFPLNAFNNDGDVVLSGDTVIVNCPDPGCSSQTLGSAILAGYFLDGSDVGLEVDLGDLAELFLAYPEVYNGVLGDYTLADLLIGLIPSESIPWNEVDLTVPGIQNAAPPEEWTFNYLANLSLTAPAAEVIVDLELPAGFAYVPGGATLDGAPIPDPVLSCPLNSCADSNGDPRPITLTFTLNDVAAGNRVLSVATRAGFELGTKIANADAQAFEEIGDAAVTASSSKSVTVIAPADIPISPVIIDTIGSDPCLGDGTGDVNLGWIASTTDGADFYRFDISQQAALCGVRADIFLSNLPVDLDLTLYGAKSSPLRGVPTESIDYLDDVTLDLNPFDDVVQADTVQDIPQVLPSVVANPNAFAVAAISANRGTTAERIKTGTLRQGTYYLQVTGYNGAQADTPYALRLRIDGTVSRADDCSTPLPYPGVGPEADITPSPLPLIANLPDGLNTLFLVNTQLLEFTYGAQARTDIMTKLVDSGWAAADVTGAVLPVDADPDVRAALKARAADWCNPDRSNDVVRAIGDLIDTYTDARPGIEYIVIIGDDRQIPMANIVDDANFANERTFAQEFANDPNNESIAALAAGRYRTDDPYGAEAGIRVRDHELFVPTRAVGRLVETPAEILTYLENFLTYQGQLDPDTAQRTALQTGYEFLSDGAELNAANLTDAGFDVDKLINDTWTDESLVAALTRDETEPHLDVVGIHAHFDANNALPAYDNFNPPVSQDELFNSSELPDNIRRAVVYSMGCHSGYSLSDIQIGAGITAPDWAQVVTGDRTNVYAANTGYGYGDTDRVALTEQLTAIFADEVTRDGSVGQAWVNAKQRFLSEIFVLDAYQEKSVQQFVLYGLPMFRVGEPGTVTTAGSEAGAFAAAAAPDTDANGQSIATIELRGAKDSTDPAIGNFERFDRTDGSYYALDGRTLEVNGHPIQPLYAETVPAFVGLEARDALITDMTSVDIDTAFDPLFFAASPNFGGPRAEYFDGSFPAEMATVRSFELDGERRQQVLIAAGQFRADDNNPDVGTQRLHTRVETEIYYSSSDDFTAPTIMRSTGEFDSDAIRFEVDVEVTEAEATAGDEVTRVYVLYRKPPSAGVASEWVGLDLAPGSDGLWKGVGPFSAELDDAAEFIIQAVDSNGNVAMSNNKSRYFLESTRGDIANIELTAVAETGALVNGWYTGDVSVTVNGATEGSAVFYRVDAGAYKSYPADGFVIPEADTGAHIISAYDTAGGFDALVIRIDSDGPTVSIERQQPATGESLPADAWSPDPVSVTISADDEGLSGIAQIETNINGTATTYNYPDPPDTDTNQVEQVDSITVDADGITTITATAFDVAGNEGTATIQVRVDQTAPTATLTVTNEFVGIDGTNAANFDCTDFLSGIDTSGIDTCVVTVTGPDGTTSGNLNPTNALSGIGVGLPTSPGGEYTVTVTATDRAGNKATATDSYTVDLEVPTATLVVDTTIVGFGGANQADFSCSDAESGTGIDTCVVTVTGPDETTSGNLNPTNALSGIVVGLPTSPGGDYTVTVTATDRAGNKATATASYTVDLLPPTVAITVTDAIVGIGDTNTASFICSDAGIDTCVVTVTRPDSTTSGNLNSTNAPSGTVVGLPTSDGGVYTVTVTATDKAGNQATATASYTVDLLPPTVAITVLHDVVDFGALNTADFECTDDELGTGIASCVVTVTRPNSTTVNLNPNNNQLGTDVVLPTSQSGRYTVTVTATDRAGNKATATASYTVDLCVTTSYDPDLAKIAGSNYTIRIELCDNAGNNISSRDIVLTAFAISDSEGNTYDPGVNDSGAANSNGLEFRYSNREGYTYNLNTTGYNGPAGLLTLDFEAKLNGDVLGIGHAPFTLS